MARRLLSIWFPRLASDHALRSRPCEGAFALTLPLLVFLLLTLLVPIAALLQRGVENPEVANTLPATIEALHGWMPGQQQGRGWEPLALTRISEPMLATEGLVGYELAFSTTALYRGQD